MALQFIFGASQTGKTKYIYEKMIENSIDHPNENYFLIVPDQSTLNAQRELVTVHPNHGTMNIDVVGFFRLAYRIFDELSYIPKEVLGDEGKSMVIRKIMEANQKKLSVFASSIGKQGFIDEMKSFFSEMCQYDVTKEVLENTMKEMEKEDSLHMKLEDILFVYEKFVEELGDTYMMSEQLLDVLAKKIGESKLLKGGTFYFDGFTGFSPVQQKVIREILKCASKVVISFTVDAQDVYKKFKEYELFAMPKKEAWQLREAAKEMNISIEPDILMEEGYIASKEIAHLERNMFRFPFCTYEDKTKDIRIYKALNVMEECGFVTNQIESLVREQGYRYEDIFVMAGDVESYRGQLEQNLKKLHIPYFMDGSQKLKNNPCIETILSALRMVQFDFPYDMVFRYLKSGFSSLEQNEVDLLENIMLEQGIEHLYRLKMPFTSKHFDEESLKLGNEYREHFLEEVIPFKEDMTKKDARVIDMVTALYEFLVKIHMEEQIDQKVQEFEEEKEYVLAKTYSQIYGQVMDLFDRMVDILGNEIMSYEDFCGVLESGLDEISVGVIPPSLDQVTIGDVERTRSNHGKVMFFVGVNEGIVPMPKKQNGILSDSQKEKLDTMGIVMAPTARKNAYIDQYYLYLAVSKPCEKLYFTYPAMNAMGESLMPSYVLNKIQKIFPKITKLDISKEEAKKSYTVEDALESIIEEIQRLDEESPSENLRILYQALDDLEQVEKYIDAHFYVNQEEKLEKKLVTMLYGNELNNSVTRMEKFSSCAFAHFMQYGLKLRERLVHKLMPTDLGTIFHTTMELVGKNSSWTWEDDAHRDTFVEDMVMKALEIEDSGIMKENYRNQYTVERIKRMAKRAVWAVEHQVKRGEFLPAEYEVAFSHKDNLDVTKIQLEDGTIMNFQGVVDRLDMYEDEEHVYLKIVDYKSGNTQFDFTTIFHGMQLQLVVYMNAMMELIGKKQDKKVVPAGMFYSRIDDPIIAPKNDSEPEIEVLKNLKLSGVANEDFEILEKLEKPDGYGVLTVPYDRKKNGDYTKYSSILSNENMMELCGVVQKKIVDLGNEMVSGKIDIEPYEYIYNACTFCPYINVCAIDSDTNKVRKLKKISKDDAIDYLQGGE